MSTPLDAITGAELDRLNRDQADDVWRAAAEARLAQARSQLEAQRRQVADYLAQAVASALGLTS